MERILISQEMGTFMIGVMEPPNQFVNTRIDNMSGNLTLKAVVLFQAQFNQNNTMQIVPMPLPLPYDAKSNKEIQINLNRALLIMREADIPEEMMGIHRQMVSNIVLSPAGSPHLPR